MSSYPSHALTSSVLDAFIESGASGILIPGAKKHPRKFVVSTPDGRSLSIWIYIWTLTHGGRISLPNEFRIQMTTVESPLPLNPLGYTVLLGYEPNLNAFAGFDLDKHRIFTKGSPSVQIDINTVRVSLTDGIAFDKKSNDEIAIAFRPDQLLAYTINSIDLHRYGKQASILSLLQKATSLQYIDPSETEKLTGPRERVITEISKLSRSSSFRQQVMRAYGSKCAISGIQLQLVDAAHILPVGAPGSNDSINNGIALSPTYHRALDSSLIYIDT